MLALFLELCGAKAPLLLCRGVARVMIIYLWAISMILGSRLARTIGGLRGGSGMVRYTFFLNHQSHLRLSKQLSHCLNRGSEKLKEQYWSIE